MLATLREWQRRHLSDPQARALLLAILAIVLVVLFLGDALLPALIALGIAYLLEGVVKRLTRRGWPRKVAVIVVFAGFLIAQVAAILMLLPPLYSQTASILRELPQWVEGARALIARLPEQYPEYFGPEQVDRLVEQARAWAVRFGASMLGGALSAVPFLIALVVYGILVPLLVYFFLADKDLILRWCGRFFPRHGELLKQVWREIDRQLGNYLRGKAWEIVIVGAAAYVMFLFFDLRYAVLLSVFVGLSVLIPYVGAAVVTLPILVVGWHQFGASSELLWLMVGYGILQAIDGNILATLLYSEAVHLHPVAIVVAVLLFGSWFGLIGVVFAVPLATAVNAVLKAWPRPREDDAERLTP